LVLRAYMLVEVVSSFPYLGSLITDDAECTKDILRRLANGLGIGAKLKKIWQNHGIRISTKIRPQAATPIRQPPHLPTWGGNV